MWRDAAGNAVHAPEPPEEFYAAIGNWQGAAYDRNAFTRGTVEEVDALLELLTPSGESRILDVGCGTGRHLHELARRGFRQLVGADVSAGLLHAGARRPGPAFVQADARRLPFTTSSVDIVLSLCQGGFGLTPGSDSTAVGEMARVLRSGGRLALTAFSLDYALRWAGEGEAIDRERGLHHHRTDVRGPDGVDRRFDLWTRCYTPTQLEQTLATAGLRTSRISSVEPGRYQAQPNWGDLPEILVIATKP